MIRPEDENREYSFPISHYLSHSRTMFASPLVVVLAPL